MGKTGQDCSLTNSFHFGSIGILNIPLSLAVRLPRANTITSFPPKTLYPTVKEVRRVNKHVRLHEINYATNRWK